MNKYYLAGFIDGEGYITWYHYGVRIIIGQKTREILEQISQYWDSLGCKHHKIYTQTSKSKINDKTYHGFRLHATDMHDAEIILKDILPYLIVKKDDAWKTLQKIQEKHYNTKELNEGDILKLRELGLGALRISQFYKCSNIKILKILRKHGIKGRKGTIQKKTKNRGQFKKNDPRLVQYAKNLTQQRADS